MWRSISIRISETDTIIGIEITIKIAGTTITTTTTIEIIIETTITAITITTTETTTIITGITITGGVITTITTAITINKEIITKTIIIECRDTTIRGKIITIRIGQTTEGTIGETEGTIMLIEIIDTTIGGLKEGKVEGATISRVMIRQKTQVVIITRESIITIAEMTDKGISLIAIGTVQ